MSSFTVGNLSTRWNLIPENHVLGRSEDLDIHCGVFGLAAEYCDGLARMPSRAGRGTKPRFSARDWTSVSCASNCSKDTNPP
jgi:hypothetical protein